MNTEPAWIVNDNGELGVMVNGRAYFLYKGASLEYETGLHDDGTPIMYRPVGKREFGETQWPMKWIIAGRRPEGRYTDALEYRPGLSDGAPGDCAWRPLAPWKAARGRFVKALKRQAESKGEDIPRAGSGEERG